MKMSGFFEWSEMEISEIQVNKIEPYAIVYDINNGPKYLPLGGTSGAIADSDVYGERVSELMAWSSN